MDANKAKNWARLFFFGGLLLLIVGVPLYTWMSLRFSYSSGERVGFVQKLSQRGWFCKTYEGDLAMVNMPGQPAEVFQFTVREKDVSEQINALAGHKVALQYEQHIGIPTSCFGDTEYFVVGVRKAE
jgi:hypothetical protein